MIFTYIVLVCLLAYSYSKQRRQEAEFERILDNLADELWKAQAECRRLKGATSSGSVQDDAYETISSDGWKEPPQ